MNSSIILEEEYKNNIIQIIRKIEELKISYVEKWELLKQEVKIKSIHYSIKRQKTDKEKILKIEKEIAEIENMPHYLINMNRKRYLESQLSNLYDIKTKGTQIRSRAKWVQEGEKN